MSTARDDGRLKQAMIPYATVNEPGIETQHFMV